MKKYVLDFLRRGFHAYGFGPIVWAILYLILKQQGVVEIVTIEQACVGIFSLAALAFIAGGMNVVYQIERLPLMVAILIHGSVLYVSYLLTYLVNGWLELGVAPIIVFSGIFVFGYLIIWIIIYSITRRKTEKVNIILEEKRKITGM